MSTWSRLVFGSLVMGMLAGCGSEQGEPLEPGSLEVEWRVLPLGCEGAKVDSIEVMLFHGGGQDASASSAEFNCLDGAGVIEGLEPGLYRVHIHGLDASEKVVYEAPVRRDVVVRAGVAEVLDRVNALSAARAAVEITWRFEDGRLCGAHGVEQVSAVVLDVYDSFVAAREFSCSEGVGVIDGVTPGEHRVLLEAVDAAGEVLDGIQSFSVGRGDMGQVEIVLGQE